MNYFKYKMMNTSGKIVSGIVGLPFSDEMSAILHLEESGNTTIAVKKLSSFSLFLFKFLKLSVRKKIKQDFLAEWFNNVAMMLKAGMPLSTALEESAADSDNPDFEKDINNIIFNIAQGSSFSKALERKKHLFPNTCLQLIAIGEESGTLDDRMKDSADHIIRIQEIISDTKQALLYPMFVLLAMGFATIFWFYFVVPKIVSLFEDMDVTLPPLTLFIIAISDFIQAHFVLMAVVLSVSAITVVLLYKKFIPFKKIIDWIFLKLPIVSSLIHASTLAFITEYFSLLMNAGIDIIKSITILQDSVNNEIYKDKIGVLKERLVAGSSISESFTKALIFPGFVCRMINVGEMSGTLTYQLDYIAAHYKQKLAVFVATLGKTIEPVVLVGAGILFAVIIAGLFLPIYDLVGNISNM